MYDNFFCLYEVNGFGVTGYITIWEMLAVFITNAI